MATNNPGVAVNPKVDTVLAEVVATIQESCQPIPIEQEAIDDWLSTFERPFSVRLSVAVWDVEKSNVLNAAQQHGIIAKALATLRGVSTVNRDMLRTASQLVVDNCRERFGAVGIWCS